MTRTQMALAGVAAVYLLALRGCYDIVAVTPGYAYRLNRLTGAVLVCGPYYCNPLEPKPAEKQP